LSLKELDAVSITAPTYLHHRIAVEAIGLGKNVLCEKPLGMDVSEAKDMLEKAEQKGIIHMTGFELRFIPAVTYMKQLIDEGYVGQVFQVHVRNFGNFKLDPSRPLTWREDRDMTPAGVMADLGVHQIDILRWIVGDFRSVCGQTKTFVEERRLPNGSGNGKVTTEDNAVFLAELRGGVQAVLHTSGLATWETSIEIYGSEGAISYTFERQTPNWILGRLSGTRDPDRNMKPIPIPIRLTDGLKAADMNVAFGQFLSANMCKLFAQGIRKREQPNPSFLDGLEAQRVLNALIDSARERRWIDID
jgi:predicted dehydrogenase